MIASATRKMSPNIPVLRGRNFVQYLLGFLIQPCVERVTQRLVQENFETDDDGSREPLIRVFGVKKIRNPRCHQSQEKPPSAMILDFDGQVYFHRLLIAEATVTGLTHRLV